MVCRHCKSLSVIAILLLFTTCTVIGQEASGTLSGTVNDSFGKAVANAEVTAKKLDTQQSSQATSDLSGHYSISGLPTGDYEVTASADGFVGTASKLAITAKQLTLDFTISVKLPAENLPNAPSSNNGAPSLGDLGFTPAEVQGNAQEQALLDKRTHMLKVHQKLGLITTVPLIATVVTSFGAGGKNTSNTDRTVHAALGSATAGLYFATAYFAIRAPRIKDTPKRGPIRFHEAMAWIHGPGMILTPILGAIAYEQKSKGERIHGIAQAHGPVAIVTAGAFGAALLSVSIKF